MIHSCQPWPERVFRCPGRRCCHGAGQNCPKPPALPLSGALCACVHADYGDPHFRALGPGPFDPVPAPARRAQPFLVPAAAPRRARAPLPRAPPPRPHPPPRPPWERAVCPVFIPSPAAAAVPGWGVAAANVVPCPHFCPPVSPPCPHPLPLLILLCDSCSPPYSPSGARSCFPFCRLPCRATWTFSHGGDAGTKLAVGLWRTTRAP